MIKTDDEKPRKPCFCIHLRRMTQKVTDFYDKALSPAAITVNQYSLLMNIRCLGECGTGELAQKVRLEKSTLVRTLQPLFKAGLIMDASAGKARRRSLRLTPAGETALDIAFPLWEKAQAEISELLGVRYEDFEKLFERIAEWG